jgi:hypothetical protein
MMEDVGTSANQLVQLDSNAKVPAVDGSLLTGMSTTLSGASDPTLSTNPSGVGIKYKNTTDGEMFICTDATAGSNVWINVGAGTGDVAPFHFVNCTTSYFTSGGYNGSNHASIDKNAVATDGNSTDQGDLTLARRGITGTSSTTHGYVAGGYGWSNIIDKFAMAATANSTDVGNLTTNWQTATGITSTTHGYIAGGSQMGPGVQDVQKYSFATDGDSVSIGNLIQHGKDYTVGGSSETHGYILGGNSGTSPNQIDKFDYASETATHAVGTLVAGNNAAASQSTDGYVYATGKQGNNSTTRIDKMSTASDSSTVASGSTLSDGIFNWATGASSTTYGYTMGGYRVSNSNTHSNVIDKFSFSSTGTATDVGDLTIARSELGGSQQY